MSLKNILKYIKSPIRVKGSDNKYDKKLLFKQGSKIKIDGNNNEIITGKNCDLKKCKICIQGDNNKIIIEDNVQLNCDINIGLSYLNNADSVIVKIGKNTTSNGFFMLLLEPESQVIIGEDCMLSSGIEMWATDTHSITDMEGKILNYANKIEIGNHVWIGKDAKITKRAKIANDSIVGFNSIVTSKFEQPNVILAGNPAVVVKQGIKWNRQSPFNYAQNKN